jgi:hypothetical protein
MIVEAKFDGRRRPSWFERMAYPVHVRDNAGASLVVVQIEHKQRQRF